MMMHNTHCPDAIGTYDRSQAGNRVHQDFHIALCGDSGFAHGMPGFRERYSKGVKLRSMRESFSEITLR